jgi:uncharacterized protein (TIGR03066 family)
MRTLLVFAALALPFALSADDKKEKPADVDSAKLVGKWNGTKILGEVPKAGESATLEFTQDGKVLMAIVDKKSKIEMKGTYTVKGPLVTLKLNGHEDKPDDILVVKLTDTALHIRQVARKENMVDEFEREKGK